MATGHAGTVETDDVELRAGGCIKVMQYLKMLPGSPKPVEHPVWIGTVHTTASEKNGMFFPLVKRGTYAAEGTMLGSITNYVGNRIQEAQAPAAGVVLFVRAVPSITKGETIANIGTVVPSP